MTLLNLPRECGYGQVNMLWKVISMADAPRCQCRQAYKAPACVLKPRYKKGWAPGWSRPLESLSYRLVSHCLHLVLTNYVGAVNLAPCEYQISSCNVILGPFEDVGAMKCSKACYRLATAYG